MKISNHTKMVHVCALEKEEFGGRGIGQRGNNILRF